MSILTGIATGIFTTKALTFFNRLFTNGKIMYDISLLENHGNLIKLEFIVTNYSGTISEIQLKRTHLFKKGPNGEVTKVSSKELDFDGMRLQDGESHRFTQIYVENNENLLSNPLVQLVAAVNQKEVNLKPFQFYKNLGVYDSDRAAAYKSISS